MAQTRTKGHRRQPGDEELVKEFLEAIKGLSTHKAEAVVSQTLGVRETVISHGTISRLRRGTWKGLTSTVRQAIRDFLEARANMPQTWSARAAELLTVARYFEHFAGELRRIAGADPERTLEDIPLIPAERLVTLGDRDEERARA